MSEAPRWTNQDAEYYGSLAICMICGEDMEVGQAYWLNRTDMIREPPRVFHAACRSHPHGGVTP
jgi:hypothetical protein